jgi:predicted membrane protein
MDTKTKRILTIIVAIFLLIMAISIVGFILKQLIPLAVLVIIGYFIYRLVSKKGQRY